MLDPFRAKSRANPQKMPQKGVCGFQSESELSPCFYRNFAEVRTKVIPLFNPLHYPFLM